MPIVSVAIFVFTLYCLLDVALSERDGIRTFPKPIWLAFVLLLPIIGGVAWLAAGRPVGGRRPGGSPPPRRSAPPRSGTGGRPGPPPPRRSPGRGAHERPKGPDDDPEFLRRLGEQLQRRDEDE